MLVRAALLTLVVLATSACSKPPTAAEACAKLEAGGIAKNCAEVKPRALTARASQNFNFDLVEVPGKTGQVMSFAAEDDYNATVEGFKTMAILAGPHRYGNPKARIFVQMNEGASLEAGKRAQSIVESL
ncbi:hypothetical protein WME88_27420 [Sorangium sp. So ce216]